MKLKLIKVNQPIGQFYITSISVEALLNSCFINRRDYNPQLLMSIGGVQRKESKERIKQIKNYCSDPDATFPSAVIVSIETSRFPIINNIIEINDTDRDVFEIIDGQHRILGLNESECKKAFDIPLVIMPDLTEEEKAYVFSTINSNQKRIDPSLIYDLFDVSEKRSPQKTIHEIARALNTDSQSPFYRKLKMLGFKTQETEVLSQGSFVNALLPLISKDPKKDMIDIKRNQKLSDNQNLPLRKYFINNNDDIIYKVIMNYFLAVSSVFSEEWSNSKKYILNRSTGFGGLCMSLGVLVKVGQEQKTLNYDFFEQIMINFKKSLDKQNKKLTSKDYPSSISLQRTLKNEILEASNIKET